jgi:hypothetical protein
MVPLVLDGPDLRGPLGILFHSSPLGLMDGGINALLGPLRRLPGLLDMPWL